MNILETIVLHKQKEVVANKALMSAAELRQQNTAMFERAGFSLAQHLLLEGSTGIIAEFKRRSPSKGMINDRVTVADVTAAYVAAGAAGLSVLTDTHFFGGSTEDLQVARQQTVPILRKDFIIDEYQLFEAKAMGADVILLIAACLTPRRVRELAAAARMLGLEVLLELHDEDELGHICDDTLLIGVNNRSLKTFVVDIERSLAMAAKIPAGKIKIAESGIDSAATIGLFKAAGFRGFLMGEFFMKQTDPGKAMRELVQSLKD
jgi:indole-3-glycerol phosphate synthase